MKLANAAYFAESVQKVFEMMCGLKVAVAPPKVFSEGSPTADVSGIITFSGDLIGAMVLTFPEGVAGAVVQALASEVPPDPRAPEFLDAVGELANMVAGQAKSRYAGYEASISIPTVVTGQAHHINRQRQAPWVVLPCQSAPGPFVVAMSLVEKTR